MHSTRASLIRPFSDTHSAGAMARGRHPHAEACTVTRCVLRVACCVLRAACCVLHSPTCRNGSAETGGPARRAGELPRPPRSATEVLRPPRSNL